MIEGAPKAPNPRLEVDVDGRLNVEVDEPMKVEVEKPEIVVEHDDLPQPMDVAGEMAKDKPLDVAGAIEQDAAEAAQRVIDEPPVQPPLQPPAGEV